MSLYYVNFVFCLIGEYRIQTYLSSDCFPSITDCVIYHADIGQQSINQVATPSLEALNFEVKGQKKKRWPKWTWKKQVGGKSVMIGLRREDALCQLKWSVGVNQIDAGLR